MVRFRTVFVPAHHYRVDVDISAVAAAAPAAHRDSLGSGGLSPGYILSFRILHGLGVVAEEDRGGAYGRVRAVVSRPTSSYLQLVY